MATISCNKGLGWEGRALKNLQTRCGRKYSADRYAA
jgi:hypothetical protein